VLNPAQQAEYAEWTQLDWVEQRCPENLFVQIGHNHGLFQVGFSATVTGTPIDSITQNGGSSDSYWVQWQKLADRLAKLPEAVKQILVVRLPKVGAVGNLMPTDAARTNGYAMAYEPTLSTHPRMAGTVLASVDQAILTVNTAIEKTLLDAETAARAGKPSRVIFFDAYQFLEQLDFKNTENAALRVEVLPSVTVDNLYLDGSIRFGWPPISYQLASGGLFGVDGMHPSGVGYAALASGLMKQLGINHDRDALLQLAYHDDRLLSNYPPELDMVVNLLETLRQAINVNYFSHEPTGSITEDTHFADILRGMKSVFDPN
jgi:hypothetical protein